MLAYPDTNPGMRDDEKLAARDRLYRRLVAAHCGNDAVDVEQVEEWVIVELEDPRWRVFLGFFGYVELVHDDSPAEAFDVNDPGDDDLGWYHHQLMTDPVGYAQGLLDESGIQKKRAEEERVEEERRIAEEALIKQVRLLVVGAEDEADFEATYGTDPDEIAVYTNAAREIVALVRAADGRAS